MQYMKDYIFKQIHEISSSLELRLAGVGLCLVHVATYFLWKNSPTLGAISGSSETICWPQFPDCSLLQFLTFHQLRNYLLAYSCFAALGAVLFLHKRTVAVAFWMLPLINTMKVFVMWQDYRFMSNYHYMAFVATFVFLFISQKAWSYRAIILAFYISAAISKFNFEWLSGSTLPAEWIKPGTLPVLAYLHGFSPLLCAYVVILEMVFIFGLMSKDRRIFTFTFVQLVAFHTFSNYIVGWYSPTVMACLLLIFPIGAVFQKNFPRPDFDFKDSKFRGIIAALLIYAGMQLIPVLIPGDAALTGEGRMWAVNMFDVIPVCYAKAVANFDDKVVDASESDESLPNIPRIKCDPWVYFERAKRKCRSFSKEPGFKGITLSLVTRKESGTTFYTIIKEENICSPEIRYSTFLPNSWIKK
jgi:hypothetical protein